MPEIINSQLSIINYFTRLIFLTNDTSAEPVEGWSLSLSKGAFTFAFQNFHKNLPASSRRLVNAAGASVKIPFQKGIFLFYFK